MPLTPSVDKPSGLFEFEVLVLFVGLAVVPMASVPFDAELTVGIVWVWPESVWVWLTKTASALPPVAATA